MTDFKSARTGVDLVAVASQYTTLNRSKGGPCPLSGCGGRDRFFIQNDREHWLCRKCGQKGDVFDLVAAMEGITTTEAIRRLTGGAFTASTSPRLRSARPAAQPQAPQPWESQDWQDKATAALNRARAALAGSDGLRYLADRGIDQATAERFALGFDPHRWCELPGSTAEVPRVAYRPALVLPWFNPDGRLWGIKYRFTDQLTAEQLAGGVDPRFNFRKGSKALLFGAQSANTDAPALVVIEGDINALSVTQVTALEGLAVVSIGGQSNQTGLALAAQLAEKYPRVLCWLDEPARAIEAQKLIPRAVAFRSPGGKDANDILSGEHGPEVLRLVVLKRLGLLAPHVQPTKSAEIAPRMPETRDLAPGPAQSQGEPLQNAQESQPARNYTPRPVPTVPKVEDTRTDPEKVLAGVRQLSAARQLPATVEKISNRAIVSTVATRAALVALAEDPKSGVQFAGDHIPMIGPPSQLYTLVSLAQEATS